MDWTLTSCDRDLISDMFVETEKTGNYLSIFLISNN